MRKEKQYHYIYKTTNLKNGKFYVGMHSTDNLKDGYLGSGLRLRRSIRRNGIENFKIEHLEFFDNRIDLANREKQLVNEELLKDAMCMNLKIGGNGGGKLHKMTPEQAKLWHGMGGKKTWQLHRESMSLMITEKNKKNWRDGVFNCHNGNTYWVGKKHKNESKLKIGEANSVKQKGEANSQFGTRWITNGIENKKIKKTDELPKGWEFGRK
jgi:hypothetical protein